MHDLVHIVLAFIGDQERIVKKIDALAKEAQVYRIVCIGVIFTYDLEPRLNSFLFLPNLKVVKHHLICSLKQSPFGMVRLRKA